MNPQQMQGDCWDHEIFTPEQRDTFRRLEKEGKHYEMAAYCFKISDEIRKKGEALQHKEMTKSTNSNNLGADEGEKQGR